MKKIIAVVLILLLMLGLCACKSKKADEEIAVSASESDAVKGSDKENDVDKPAQEQSTETSADEQQSNTVTEQPDITTNTDAEDTDNQKEVETDSPDAPVTNEQRINDIITKTPSDDDKDKQEIIRGEVLIETSPVSHDTVEDVAKRCLNADLFVGKIVSEKEIIPDDPIYQASKDDMSKKNSYFVLNEDIKSELFSLNAKLYMYTVEVEQTINSLFVQKGTKIKVISDVTGLSESYKVGNRYTMYGTLYEYAGETVLKLYTIFATKVDDDGTLHGIGVDKKAMESVGTLEGLTGDKTLQTIFKKAISIPVEYKRGYGLARFEDLMDAKNKDILERIVSDGKKAIIADSKFKMKIDTEAR